MTTSEQLAARWLADVRQYSFTGKKLQDAQDSGWIRMDDARAAIARHLVRGDDLVTFNALIDLIGELGREVFYLLDGCETSGKVGQEIHTIDGTNLQRVSSVLDRIEALPFEEPGVILGPGAMLQAALKQTFAARIAALTAQVAELDACLERQANGHREDLDGIADISVERLTRAETAEAEVVRLRAEVARMEGAIRALGVREMVAGWNGEGKDKPYTPHPAELGATIKTTCGVVYALDAALRPADGEKT